METTTEADRAEMIAGLRAMADWLEAHPGLPVGIFCPVTMNLFPSTEDEARVIRAAAPGGWKKDAHGDYLSYARSFSGNENGRCAVQYQVHLSKKQTCERVQVGTRHVEAVEAHDEPVFEWRCAPVEESPAAAPDAADVLLAAAEMDREARDPGYLEDAAAEDEDGEPCGARPYPAGSEGDDGTECILLKGHDGPHDDGVNDAPAPVLEAADIAQQRLSPDPYAASGEGITGLQWDNLGSRATA